MPLVDALEQGYEHMYAVITRVRPDQYDDPTPCPDWTVRTLLEHVVGVVRVLGAAVAGREASEDFVLAPDPAAEYADAAKAVVAAFRGPDALQTVFDGPVGRLPGEIHAAIHLIETATHRWDLAVATGQPAEVPADVAQPALDLARQFIAPSIRDSMFADEVPVGSDATTTDQLVAFLGRTPTG